MKRFIEILASAVCVVILLSLGACAARMADGTYIDGADVSGMERGAAYSLVLKNASRVPENIAVRLYSKDSDAEITMYAHELGAKFDADEAVSRALNSGSGEYFSVLKADKNALDGIISRAKAEFNTGTTNATAKYAGNGEFKYTDGRGETTVDEANLKDAINTALSKVTVPNPNKVEVEIPLKIAKGGDTSEKLKAENALLAEYTTSYNKSPLNAEGRVKNIVKAAGLLDGAVVKAGDTLDINAVLGDRNASGGWSKAPGIKNGTYVMSYGGGVCQVSSTLYNAVLLANLEVVDRTHHSWPMSYVPAGQDATISTGGPNFIFKNTTDAPITVAAIIGKDNTLTIKLFGKAAGEYAYAKVFSEKTGTIDPPAAKYINDNSVKTGAEVTERKARKGVKTVTTRVFYDENGNELSRETVTEDTYSPIGAVIAVGT